VLQSDCFAQDLSGTIGYLQSVNYSVSAIAALESVNEDLE